MATHVRVYSPAGVALGFLPDYTDLRVQYVHNDAGTLTFQYPKNGVNSGLLDADEARLAVIEDGVEWPNQFIYEEDGDDTADQDGDSRMISVSARGQLVTLEQAIIYPKLHVAGGSVAGLDPNHDFVNATPGAILKTLIDKAKARGVFPALTYNFTATLDSAGIAWPKTYSVTYAAGLDYYKVLTAMCDNGWIDARMTGSQLNAYLPDNTVARDMPNVLLRDGQQVLQGPRKRSRRGILSHILGAGQPKSNVEVSNAGSAVKHGRREGFASDGRMTEAGSLIELATYELNSHLEAKEGFSLSISLNPPPGEVWPKPGVDFLVGDRIRYNKRRLSTTAYEPLRVRTMSWDWGNSSSAPTCAIEVNDLFVEANIKLSRRVQGILNGSTTDAPPPPTPPAVDKIAPKAPASVDLTPFVYLDKTQYRVSVTIQWPPVTLNSDDSPCTDLDTYRVSYRIGGGAWTAERVSQDPTEWITGLTPGTTFQAKVAARDLAGNYSSATVSNIIALPDDTTPPPAPSTPILSTRLGTVTAAWNGKDASNAAMPSDYDHVDVHASSNPGFTPGTATFVGRIVAPTATLIITGLPYGEPRTFRYIAVDRSGNQSDPSAAATVTTQSLIDTDLIGQIIGAPNLMDDAVTAVALADGAVTAPAIAPGAVTTEKLTVGSIGDSVLLNPDFEEVSSADATLPAAWKRSTLFSGAATQVAYETATPISGARSVKLVVTAAGGSPTVNGAIESVDFAVTAGDIWYLKCKARDTHATSPGFHLGLIGGAAPGAATGTVFAFTNVAVGTAVKDYAGQVTIPAGWKYARLILLNLASLSTAAHTVTVDSTSAAKVVISAAIGDGAVLAEKIGAKAVVAGKIDTNAVTADTIEAGAISTVKLAAKAISTDKIQIGVLSSNPVPDPSFEEGYAIGDLGSQGWESYSSSASVALSKSPLAARSGQSALRWQGLQGSRTNLVTNPRWRGNLTGQAVVRTNLCTNPVFGVNTTGWAAYASLGALTRINSIVTLGTWGPQNYMWAPGTGAAGTPRFQYFKSGITPGETYSFSWWAACAEQVPLSAYAGLKWTTNGGTGTETGAGVAQNITWTATTGWQYCTLTVTVPAGVDGFRFTPGGNWAAPLATSSFFRITDVMIEKAAIPLDGFAGNSPLTASESWAHAWTGTAHASTSIEYHAGFTTAPFVSYGPSAFFSSYNPSLGCLSGIALSDIGDGAIIGFTDNVSSESVTAAAGQSYTGRVKVRQLAGTAPVDVQVRLLPYTAATAGLSPNAAASVSTTIPTDGSWVDIPVEFVGATPATTASVRFIVYAGTGGIPAGTRLAFKDAMIERVGTTPVAPYFDGITSYSGLLQGWSGTADASTSLVSPNQTRLRSGIFALFPGATYRATLNLACSASIAPHGRWSMRLITGVDDTHVTNVLTLDSTVEAEAITASGTNPPTSTQFNPYSADATIPAGQFFGRLELQFDGPATFYVDDLSLIRQGVGGASELTAAGLRLFSNDGDEIGAFVSNRPTRLSITDGGGAVLAAIDENGTITGTNLNIEGDPYFRGEALSTSLERRAKGLLAIATNPGPGTTYTWPIDTEYGLGEISWVSDAGRAYRVELSPVLAALQTNTYTVGRVNFRYAYDGAAPTISSPLYRAFDFHIPQAFGIAVGGWAFQWDTQASTRTIRMLISFQKITGSILNIQTRGSTPIELAVYQQGVLVSDVWQGSSGGGTIGGGGGGSSPTPPTNPKQQYTTTWQSTSSASYKGDTSPRSGGDGGKVYQGYYGSTQGDQSGAWYFAGTAISGEGGKTIAQALSGASVAKVEVYLHNEFWYQNNGGTARIYLHNQTGNTGNRPATWNFAGDVPNWGKGAGKWVDITATAASWVGTYRGFGVGPAQGTSSAYYGYFSGGAGAQIRITYTR